MGVDISIIIPNFNKGEFISETINSIISQEFSNWEIIFIDDNSTDNSIEIVKGFKDDRIRLISLESNMGASYCRNIGIDKASGEYLVFLDSDDILTSTCLSNRHECTLKYSEKDFLVFRMAEFMIDPENPTKIRKLSFDNFLYNHVSLNDPWGITQPIWKKTFLEKISGFNEVYGRFQDIEFHTRVILSNPDFMIIDGVYDFLYRVVNYQKEMSAFFANNYLINSFRYINEFKDKNIDSMYFRQLVFSSLVIYLRANQKNILSDQDKLLFKTELFHSFFIKKIYSRSELLFFRLLSYMSNQKLIKLRGVTYINKYILRN